MYIPINDKLNRNNIRLEIRDLSGKLEYEKYYFVNEFNNPETLELYGFPRGPHIVTIYSSENKFSKRIIVM